MPNPTQIVVVDDDPSISLALKRLLTAAGFDATTFGSAEALLQAGVTTDVDCLILDVHLPGLSGFELRRRLVNVGAATPVIFITAHDEPAVRAQAEQAGAVAYLVKPFPGRGLLAAVNRAVRPP
ncbi:MAG: response regulator [Verrucomicrobia bacterium]|nr:response regulator [Verrucomicrobiota bacterium]